MFDPDNILIFNKTANLFTRNLKKPTANTMKQTSWKTIMVMT